jgi:hypothetical protein
MMLATVADTSQMVKGQAINQYSTSFMKHVPIQYDRSSGGGGGRACDMQTQTYNNKGL